MATGQRFVLPNQFAVDPTGIPYAGGQLFFYASGTSTPLSTYSDQGLTTPNANPVVANASGLFGNIFLQSAAYKVVLEDSSGNQIWTMDPVSSSLPTTGGSVSGTLQITGAAGTVRAAQLQTAGVTRWQLDANATAESGTNAGSDLELWSYTDAGAQLTKLLAITRSSGAATYAGAWTFSSTLTVTGTSTLGNITGTGGTYKFGTFNKLDPAASLFSIENDSGIAVQIQNNSGSGPSLVVRSDTNATDFIDFTNSGVTIGYVSNDVTGVTYHTTSDHRLKLTFGPADTGALIDSVPVYDAAWEARPGIRRPMMLAHEMPLWAVRGEKDAVDADGKPIYQQADYMALVPAMWAELQSLRRRIAKLERGR